LQSATAANKPRAKAAKETLASKTASAEAKAQAKAELDRIRGVEEASEVAVKAVAKQLGDKRFIEGFGSNGGEEFLSYLNISESLVVKGGDEWAKWDKQVMQNLNRVQNKDGSWSGHHCITGRTFCTATALLVLLADRTPVPADATDDKPKDKK
jgi:hypothetical protein